MNSNSNKSSADSASKAAIARFGVNTEPLLTVEEVARYLRLQPGTVRGMARRGELPVVKVGRRWRFKRSQIESWLRENMRDQV
ncbi:MAG: helix-turn-helix domain-containing protein [Anaerolineales bacterium]|nr:helix-turn-helix domain-containing protein [Anaerolineales bacterium]